MAEPDKPTQEATELLWADHRAVLEAYERYEEVYGEEKEEISDHLIKILTAHLEIEEELFYPVLEDATARRGGADDRREDATARRGGADDRREDATARRSDKTDKVLAGEPRAKRAGERGADEGACRATEDAGGPREHARIERCKLLLEICVLVGYIGKVVIVRALG